MLYPAEVQAQWGIAQQRQDFLVARNAIKKGHYKTYTRLRARMEDYPLVGFLDYEYLRKNLKSTPTEEIRDFLDKNAGSSVSRMLRSLWLRSLAHAGQWETFLEEYQKDPELATDVRTRCYHLQARLKTKQPTGVLAEMSQIWLTDKSLPHSCDPIIGAWKKAGMMTDEIIKTRVKLAMENHKTSLARHLAKELPHEDRQWVERWIKIHKKPNLITSDSTLRQDLPIARDIVIHGVKRLARRDAVAAYDLWQETKDKYEFSTDQINEAERYIALRGAYQLEPDALDWLTSLAPGQADESVRQWRVRSAIKRRDWQSVLHWIKALPPSERYSEQWRYWQAQSLQRLNIDPMERNPIAERILSEISEYRTYYGFLAADQLGKKYSFNVTPVEADELEKEAVRSLPGIQRAYELYVLSMVADARREWIYVTKDMNNHQLKVAAMLAHEWGWHDRAVMSLAQARHLNDLELRFPIAFRSQVFTYSEENNIDPAWVYGVLRQESAYMADARSSAGAVGLMQLMPRTARMTARKLKTPFRSQRKLLDADSNIRLGSAYLRRMLDMNQSNQVLATAAYNAGPMSVRKWLPENDTLPADVWVETVPFNETRNYIQQVLAYTTIFSHRLSGEISPMYKRMQSVTPPL